MSHKKAIWKEFKKATHESLCKSYFLLPRLSLDHHLITSSWSVNQARSKQISYQKERFAEEMGSETTQFPAKQVYAWLGNCISSSRRIHFSFPLSPQAVLLHSFFLEVMAILPSTPCEPKKTWRFPKFPLGSLTPLTPNPLLGCQMPQRFQRFFPSCLDWRIKLF